jgi:hypothetical protein
MAVVDTECLMLNEFVDDAGGLKAHAETEVAPVLRELVRRIAVRTGVPRFKLDEIVERVTAETAGEIEGRLCEQIRAVMRACMPSSTPKTDAQPADGKRENDATALPA